ncbi:unnamed protein product [Caenorhabditis auriculariae]|uniref:Uncharacterized protein n=1 Tax=Caenorhabditis auriculariae TaxID=2777116 RepID=A0A8S1GRU2_9PELO|nr:unnamed protein product [Caenorhabditis auriculariae]
MCKNVDDDTSAESSSFCRPVVNNAFCEREGPSKPSDFIEFDKEIVFPSIQLYDEDGVDVFFDFLHSFYDKCGNTSVDFPQSWKPFSRALNALEWEWKSLNKEPVARIIQLKYKEFLFRVGTLSGLASSNTCLFHVALDSWKLGCFMFDEDKPDPNVMKKDLPRVIIVDGMVSSFKKSSNVFNCGCVQRVIWDLYNVDKGNTFCHDIYTLFKLATTKTYISVDFPIFYQSTPSSDSISYISFFIKFMNVLFPPENTGCEDQLLSQRFSQILTMLGDLPLDYFSSACLLVDEFMAERKIGSWDKRRRKALTDIMKRIFESYEERVCDKLVTLASLETSLWKNAIAQGFPDSHVDLAPLQLLFRIISHPDAWEIVRGSVVRQVSAKTQKLIGDEIETFFSLVLLIHFRVDDADIRKLVFSYIERNFHSATVQQKKFMLKILTTFDFVENPKWGKDVALLKSKVMSDMSLEKPEEVSMFIENVSSLPECVLSGFNMSRVVSSLDCNAKLCLFNRLTCKDFEIKSSELWEEALKMEEDDRAVCYLKMQLRIGLSKGSPCARGLVGRIFTHFRKEKVLPRSNILLAFCEEVISSSKNCAADVCDLSFLVHLWIVAVCNYSDSHNRKVQQISISVWELVRKWASFSVDLKKDLEFDDSITTPTSVDYLEHFFKRSKNLGKIKKVLDVRCWMNDTLPFHISIMLKSGDDRVKERTLRVVTSLLYEMGDCLSEMVASSKSYSRSTFIVLVTAIFNHFKTILEDPHKKAAVTENSLLFDQIHRTVASLASILETSVEPFVDARLKSVLKCAADNNELLQMIALTLRQSSCPKRSRKLGMWSELQDL